VIVWLLLNKSQQEPRRTDQNHENVQRGQPVGGLSHRPQYERRGLAESSSPD